MRANYEYLLEKCAELGGAGRILDYGCGGGTTVEAGRARNLDIVGVEAFYAGSRAKDIAREKGLLGSAVFELQADGKIPFGDGEFSLVVSNQVFEHVENLDLVLSEIFRVLRPGGRLLAVFPTYEVWREGHCGVPFAHRFSPQSALRYPYMRAARALGLGSHKGGKSHAEWAKHKLRFLDHFTHYRTMEEIKRGFDRVTGVIEELEQDYVAFRLRRTRLARLASIASHGALRPMAVAMLRRLAGIVVLARKSDAA